MQLAIKQVFIHMLPFMIGHHIQPTHDKLPITSSWKYALTFSFGRPEMYVIKGFVQY